MYENPVHPILIRLHASLFRSLAAAVCAVCIALAACSRGPSPAERAAERSAAEAARVAPSDPVAPTPTVVAPVSPAVPPVAPPSPDPVAQNTERRRIAEELYRGMDPSIPDKDRRDAAWTMAGDVLDIARDMKSDESATERASRHSEGDRARAKIMERECASMRAELASMEDIEKNGPRERMTAEQVAAIPVQAGQLRTRLAQTCQ